MMRSKKKEEEPVQARTGVFVHDDGSRYEGEFVSNLPQDGHAANIRSPPLASAASGAPSTAPVFRLRKGRGEHHDASGARYTGTWSDDLLSGTGSTVHLPSGASYVGELQAGKYHGAGRYTWSDGTYYEGSWKNNKMHGEGMYVDLHAVRWYGSFVDGKCDLLRPEIVL